MSARPLTLADTWSDFVGTSISSLQCTLLSEQQDKKKEGSEKERKEEREEDGKRLNLPPNRLMFFHATQSSVL